jgi:outer membrane lipoprotein SlyB
MPRIVICAVLAIAFVALNAPAEAKGCIKGAVVGGAAGHLAGHHGVLGAVAGCVIGHHEANKRPPPQPITTGSAPK